MQPEGIKPVVVEEFLGIDQLSILSKATKILSATVQNMDLKAMLGVCSWSKKVYPNLLEFGDGSLHVFIKTGGAWNSGTESSQI